MSRKISQAGMRLIQSFEGCRLTAYKPVATEQYYTIGWGHYGPDVKQGMTITQAQADSMLIADLTKYEGYVSSPSYVSVTEKLTQHQFDALTSFCYNCGAGNLQRLCKGRTVAEIAMHIAEYNKSNGTVLPGLMRRRQAELELFNKEVAEEEDEMQLSNYQWEVLENNVKKLLDSKTVTDASWLKKIKDRTITTPELAWLTFVVSMR